MGLIIFLILGAFIGWLATKVTGNDAEFGWVANTIIGVLGSIFGAYVLGRIFGLPSGLVFDIVPLVGAFLGSVILLVIYNWIRSH